MWLALIGALATLNQQCLSRALTAADATAVLPFLFMRLPFAAVLGYLAFAEIPALWVWIGGAIIFGAALYLARGEARLGRRASP
jgi:drug/metabolite transporter (DMT)-like permease